MSIAVKLNALDPEVLRAAEVLRAFLNVKYYREMLDDATLYAIRADVADFCARRKELPSMTIRISDRYSIELFVRD